MTGNTEIKHQFELAQKRFVFFEQSKGRNEVRLRADAPGNDQDRSVYLGLVLGKSGHWAAESSDHQNFGVHVTREMAALRLLEHAKSRGVVQ
jgi:hypothetical protein